MPNYTGRLLDLVLTCLPDTNSPVADSRGTGAPGAIGAGGQGEKGREPLLLMHTQAQKACQYSHVQRMLDPRDRGGPENPLIITLKPLTFHGLWKIWDNSEQLVLMLSTLPFQFSQ